MLHDGQSLIDDVLVLFSYSFNQSSLLLSAGDGDQVSVVLTPACELAVLSPCLPLTMGGDAL